MFKGYYRIYSHGVRFSLGMQETPPNKLDDMGNPSCSCIRTDILGG